MDVDIEGSAILKELAQVIALGAISSGRLGYHRRCSQPFPAPKHRTLDTPEQYPWRLSFKNLQELLVLFFRFELPGERNETHAAPHSLRIVCNHGLMVEGEP